MPRGSEYANAPPQSDNPIGAGENKAHGVSGVRSFPQYSELFFLSMQITDNLFLQSDDLSRTHKTAEFPEGAIGTGTTPLSGQGSAGHESGKGGHETKTLGENKGHGAQGV